MRRWWSRRGRNDELTCQQVGELVQSFLDDQLDEATARRLTRHLDMCRVCGMEVDTFRAITKALRDRNQLTDEAALARLHDFAHRLTRSEPTGVDQ
jgi:anti-sigma factor RsiW